jgi:hypothetical protein
MFCKQANWMMRLAGWTLLGAGFLCLLPTSADAQVFGGRLRARIRGEAPPRPDDVLILERDYASPRASGLDDREAVFEPRPRLRDRARADSRPDYGPGVGERTLNELGISLRRRSVRDSQRDSGPDIEIPSARSADTTARAPDGRRSVLRAPLDGSDDRDDLAAGRPDYVYDDDLPAPRTTTRGERTVRVDRFDKSASVSPAEDPYEREDADTEQSLRARDLARDREIEMEARDLDSPEPELRDARGSRVDDDLVEEAPEVVEGPSRIDDGVRPAAADAAIEEGAIEEHPVDAKSTEGADDFDRPRAARSEQPSTTTEAPAAKPATSSDIKQSILKPTANSRNEKAKDTNKTADRKPLPSPPAPKPKEDADVVEAELLPAPPPDDK